MTGSTNLFLREPTCSVGVFDGPANENLTNIVKSFTLARRRPHYAVGTKTVDGSQSFCVNDLTSRTVVNCMCSFGV